MDLVRADLFTILCRFIIKYNKGERLTPISAPNPYLNPSANRVDAFQYTPAASITFMNLCALSEFSVMIRSVCFEP